MQTYMSRKRADQSTPQQKSVQKARAMPMNAISGTEVLGKRVDLPEAIRAKMESSFGADLSGVKLYESQAVADAGAEAVTMGNQIGFAPGKLDFVSGSGQSLLGHEMSHVVSQARGEVTGSGFLNDHALEARADHEGALAAAGESVYAGPVTPVSVTSSPAPGPMQAKKDDEKSQAKAAEKQVDKATAAGNKAYDKAAKRYRKQHNMGRKDKISSPSMYHERYLRRQLRNVKDPAEQDAMFAAFTSGDNAAIAGYLKNDVNQIMGTDFSSLDSESSEDAAAAYGNLGALSMDVMPVSDLMKNPEIAGQMGLSQEEADAFKSKKMDIAASSLDAHLLNDNKLGKENGFHSRESIEARRAARRNRRAGS